MSVVVALLLRICAANAVERLATACSIGSVAGLRRLKEISLRAATAAFGVARFLFLRDWCLRYGSS